MDTQKLIRKGLLNEKKEKLDQLKIKTERLVKDINYYLYGIEIEGIEGMKIEHAEQAMGELAQAVHEYRGLEAEIKRIEKES